MGEQDLGYVLNVFKERGQKGMVGDILESDGGVVEQEKEEEEWVYSGSLGCCYCFLYIKKCGI